MTTTPNDPVIDEIREIRHRISERFDHDPERLVEHYIELQKRHQDRLATPPKVAGGEEAPAA